MFDDIQRQHVELAERELRRDGIPPRRCSRGRIVVVDSHTYPPKYLMSVARRYAHGNEPGCWDVHTKDAVRRLQQLGYVVN
jgi:hypothetical protein